MKEKINILFVCGYGVGSSVMLQTVVKKALAKYNIAFEMEHTAAGEVAGLPTGPISMQFLKNSLMWSVSIRVTGNISSRSKILWTAKRSVNRSTRW